MGQLYKNTSIVFFVLILCFSTILTTLSVAEDATVTISMLQGEQQTRFNKPVLVTGIWYYVNITTDQSVDALSLRLYKGIMPPIGQKNETNYYEWSYDKNTEAVWSDESGYGIEYLQPELCQVTGSLVSFCIGVKDFMPNIVDYYENWTLEVGSDGTTIHSEGIVAEKPKTGVSSSKPSSIIFHVDPFTLMDAQGDNFFKLGNIGNIPLTITFDANTYSEIEMNDVNKIFLPGETFTHYVTVHSRSWPPGFKNINVQLIGSYPQSYFVDSNATVTLYTSFIIDLPLLVIYVGHSNYKIEEIQGTGITFQYIEKVNMYEGEIKEITAYVSGNGPVTAEIWADEKNISALKLSDNGVEVRSPLSFTSTNTSERIIKVTVQALSEGTIGILSYRITGNSITQTYVTKITVGPPVTPEEGSGGSLSVIQLVVIGIVVLVVVYMIISYLRNRKR